MIPEWLGSHIGSHSKLLRYVSGLVQETPHVCLPTFVTTWGKSHFEFCIRCKGTLDKLPIALYWTLLAGSVSRNTNIQFSRKQRLNIYLW